MDIRQQLTGPSFGTLIADNDPPILAFLSLRSIGGNDFGIAFPYSRLGAKKRVGRNGGGLDRDFAMTSRKLWTSDWESTVPSFWPLSRRGVAYFRSHSPPDTEATKMAQKKRAQKEGRLIGSGLVAIPPQGRP